MARILIIEDNPTNMQLMGYLLRAFDHTVEEAADGETGLARAAEGPDLILCDIQIPGLDGYQVARWLKSHPSLRAVPLIAVTALAMVGDRDRIMSAGFDGYLPKPIEPEAFVQQVESYLSRDHPISAKASQAARLTPQPLVAAANTKSRSDDPLATILVVDNLPVNLELARSILEPFGYRVLTANGIPDGLAAARAERCDLILSDVCMGSPSAGNGFDLLRAVLADPQLCAIPFVFITSTMLDEDARLKALEMGATRYLVRPIEPEAMQEEIKHCLLEK